MILIFVWAFVMWVAGCDVDVTYNYWSSIAHMGLPFCFGHACRLQKSTNVTGLAFLVSNVAYCSNKIHIHCLGLYLSLFDFVKSSKLQYDCSPDKAFNEMKCFLKFHLCLNFFCFLSPATPEARDGRYSNAPRASARPSVCLSHLVFAL